MRDIQVSAPSLVPGLRLFRNNVGVAKLENGSRLRYGLAVGSADLIGWLPIVIGTQHIGMTIARFMAVEVKSKRGKLSPEQQAFLNAVRNAGGIATMARSIDELSNELRAAI